MRVVAALVLGFVSAAPSSAQWQPVPAPAPVYPPAARLWNPAADYIISGQDEPGYRRWVAAQPWRGSWVQQFHAYLAASGVSYVAPTWQLLRTASDWQRCGADPFEVPPTQDWPNIVNTLRYVRDHVVPRVGPVEPVSVFRNAGLNRCAGGAAESVHKSMSAIDFVPLQPIDRTSLIRRLCSEHQVEGPRFNAGLGFYTKLRFHVDSWKYRTWGRGDHGETACPKVQIAPPPTLASAPTPGSTAAAGPADALTFRVAPIQVPATKPVAAPPISTPIVDVAPSTSTAVVTGASNKDPLAPIPDSNSGR